MKNFKTLLFLLILPLFSLAQDGDKSISGNWYNQEKDAVIEIKQVKNIFQGKVTWMSEPNNKDGSPKRDKLNPDESLRSQPRLGKVIMTGFTFEEDNVWGGGEIYDPKSGKTYNGTITLTSKNKLDLRGYVGLPIFGKTSSWTRKTD
jgi:uncharacterized protein (DUF2147 family)